MKLNFMQNAEPSRKQGNPAREKNVQHFDEKSRCKIAVKVDIPGMEAAE
ncbi:MAG: hypothetical protein LKJ17_07055 [Oscillospiraceae bacterium]|jgi:hypothetical protein|nr:hypothetical protein [Oscillospiraceae bacterium]